MSRIGKVPISIPEGINIKLSDTEINVSGPLGSLNMPIDQKISINILEDQILVSPKEEQYKALWGTYRTLIEQLIIGSSQGYVVNLELVGVGYKATVEENKLILKLGYSHDITHIIPEGIQVICRRPTFISIIGINKQKVHQEAARIRAYKKPEPYKGKGILYENEVIIKKEGKKK